MLHVTGLSKAYKTAQNKDVTQALSDINFSLDEGASLAIVGPSGCGKSTLLRLIAGLITPTEGSISIHGEDVTKPRKKTAFMLQDFGLLPWKTVEQNAGLALQLQGVPAVQRKKLIHQVLSDVGLFDFRKAYPSSLSGGMKQRLSLARALSMDSDLLLMDEPLSALDAFLREDMQVLLKNTWLKHSYTQIIVTHSIAEAVFLGEKIIVMSPLPGKIVSVFENPHVKDKDWRTQDGFHALTSAVRESLLEAKGGMKHA